MGLHAPWFFDDTANFIGLKQVVDGGSAMEFVFDGISSAIGRPLSMASFLINLNDWPDNPAAFRSINILLHVINGGLLAWLVLLIARVHPASSVHAWAIAATTAALWTLHPFLASTVLSAVQRMTLLAGFFTLLGLIGYIHGRQRLAHSPLSGLIWMSSALAGCSLIGVLAKENAALLPIFAMVLEFGLLYRLHQPLPVWLWRSWTALFLWLPLLLLIGYGVYYLYENAHAYAIRSFDASERLMTQSVILWEYVRQIIIPRTSLMGPFQDDKVIYSHADLVFWVASAAWLLALVIAIKTRKTIILPFIAVFGFLAGHLLESTIFSLELYFEHRNYLPSAFIIGSIAATLWLGSWRLALFGSTVFAIFFAGLLWMTTSLWGDQLLAGEMWHRAHPTSSRAAQFLAQRYLLMDDEAAARHIINKTSNLNPNASDLLLQKLQMNCGVVAHKDIQQQIEQTLALLPSAHFSNAAFDALSKTQRLVEEENCQGLTSDSLYQLYEAILENPRFQSSSIAKDHLYNQLASLSASQGNLNQSEHYQRLAFSALKSPENAAMLAIRLLQQGKTTQAKQFLAETIEQNTPSSGFRNNRWEKVLLPILESLSGLERSRSPAMSNAHPQQPADAAYPDREP